MFGKSDEKEEPKKGSSARESALEKLLDFLQMLPDKEDEKKKVEAEEEA